MWGRQPPAIHERAVSTPVDRLELRTGERLLIGQVGPRTLTLRLRSSGRLGLCAYLLRARLHGDREGWRDRHDIVAEAPGCANQSAASVGKRIGELFDNAELAHLVIAFGGGPVAGPWRIRTEPSRIHVADPLQFEQLFADARALRTSSPVVLDPALLDEVEAWAARGVFTRAVNHQRWVLGLSERKAADLLRRGHVRLDERRGDPERSSDIVEPRRRIVRREVLRRIDRQVEQIVNGVGVLSSI